METKTPPIRHDPIAQRFELSIEDTTAVAEYRREAGRVIFTHTFVPPALRGKGLAESLAHTALQWARAEKLKIVPVCSYIARFVERHPEYNDRV